MSEFRRYGTDPEMDVYVDNEDWRKRKYAAKLGYGLDKLVNDEEWVVRIEVAWQGYGLEKLINDEVFTIRMAVAEQGYGLDKLIDDEYFAVREEVAKQGYGLDKLINDEHWDVRTAVVRKNYGLNVLINDESEYIRDLVSYYLKKHNYKSIAEWAIANPDKIHGADVKDFKVQEDLQEDLKDFIYKIDDSPKLKVESSYDSIDEFFNDSMSNSNASDFNELIICTVDTKQPIIKIQKTVKEDKTDFKFIVDITTEDGDSFVIKTTIKSKEQLNSKIQETVESLRAQKEFNKYADDLEACL